MFKLVKLFVCLVGLAAFTWWGLTVQLGERTLFGHIAAIGRSKESKELVRGTKQKVADLERRFVGGKSPPEPPPGPPQEHLTKADRHDLRRLVESARSKPARASDD